MGVLTSVHQVPLSVLKIFRKDTSMVDFLVYDDHVTAEELEMPAQWVPSCCSFDKEWEDMASILRQIGYYNTGWLLEHGGTQINCGGDVYCRYWRKTKLKQMKSELKGIDAAGLKKKAMATKELTDWDGDPAYDMLNYYLQSFDQLYLMICDAIEKEEALVATSS